MLSKKQKIILGLILCVISLILLQRNLVIPGFITFVVGFLLMNGGKMPWGRR